MKARMLRMLYPRVIDGLPVIGTPGDVVLRHTDEDGVTDVNGLIGRYTRLSGTTGFVTGLPGWLLLPIVLPADIIGNAAIQLHMTAALAIVAGLDPREEAVQTSCINCLLDHIADPGRNDEDEELAKRTGVKLGERVVRLAARRAMKYTARRAGRRLGFRAFPLLGGILGAGTDATLTHQIGQCAKAHFLSTDADEASTSTQIPAEPRTELPATSR